MKIDVKKRVKTLEEVINNLEKLSTNTELDSKWLKSHAKFLAKYREYLMLRE